MTRFARARGSKASNERTPDESTPWDLMKEQLLLAQKKSKEAKLQEEAEKKRLVNYENFLKEQKVLKRKSVWCEFEEPDTGKSDTDKLPDKKRKKKQAPANNVPNTIQNNEIEINSNEDATTSKTKKKKHKKKLNEKDDSKQENDVQILTKAKSNIKSQSTFKKQKQNVSEIKTESNLSIKEGKKKKKKNKSKASQNNDSNIYTDNENIQGMNAKSHPKGDNEEQDFLEVKDEGSSKVTEDKMKKKNKKQKNDKYDNLPTISLPEKGNHNMEATANKKAKVIKTKQKKKQKLKDGKPIRRKALNDKSFQLIINGKEVELVRFDGFPVMKKDAERLEELKRNMIKKGIPKSEIQRTIKLERRRAEKALARLKRDVCYNCRKGGHNLSDCPDLKSKIPGTDVADGICFKCGSTEHKQFECKVQKDKEFRFATCFICKQPGHIARQCPDNPKGLYPNGGCCKLCGDVTHLRKDCPTVQGKKDDSSVKLMTLESGSNVEDMGQVAEKNTTTTQTKKPKKIKF